MSWTSYKCVLCMNELFRGKPIGHCCQACKRHRTHMEYLASIKPVYEKPHYMSVGNVEGSWTDRNYLEIDKYK